jgi:hypothetical protein
MSTFAEKVVTRSGANKASLEEHLQMLHQEGDLVSACSQGDRAASYSSTRR